MGMEFPNNRRKADDSYHALSRVREEFFFCSPLDASRRGDPMRTLPDHLLVFVGAGLGGALRHSANLASARLLGPDLPVSTFVVNVLGSLMVGCIAGYVAVRGSSSQGVQLFLTTGILGGFTTFSAFSLEAALLWERGQVASCLFFVSASVLFSIAGVFAGLSLVRLWHAV